MSIGGRGSSTGFDAKICPNRGSSVSLTLWQGVQRETQMFADRLSLRKAHLDSGAGAEHD